MDITSRENAKIKLARSLRQRKARQATGFFLVEGIRHVGEAVEATGKVEDGAALEFILYAPDLLTSPFARELVEEQREKGLPCYSVRPEIFESVAEKENPQGILAVARRPKLELGSLNPQNFPWAVALIAAQDPGNIGAILRTVDAVGASGLLLLEGSADPYHPGAVRASMGAIFWYPVIETDFAAFLGWARAGGYTIYGTSARGSLDYREVEGYRYPLAVLMGSEREGLSAEQAEACDRLISLPMKGKATSLNLAVAAGVILYSILEKMECSPQGAEPAKTIR